MKLVRVTQVVHVIPEDTCTLHGGIICRRLPRRASDNLGKSVSLEEPQQGHRTSYFFNDCHRVSGTMEKKENMSFSLH